MRQLQIGDIIRVIESLEKSGFKKEEIKSMPIYLGDDDEMNGIHTAWYCQLVTEEDDQDLIEMISDNCGNIEFEKNAILIS